MTTKKFTPIIKRVPRLTPGEITVTPPDDLGIEIPPSGIQKALPWVMGGGMLGMIAIMIFTGIRQLSPYMLRMPLMMVMATVGFMAGGGLVRRASGSVHRYYDLLRECEWLGDTRNQSSLERQMHAPMAACRPCVQGANRPRGLAISILELNQAIFQGQRGARRDQGVIAASIIASSQRRCMEVCKWLISA